MGVAACTGNYPVQVRGEIYLLELCTNVHRFCTVSR